MDRAGFQFEVVVIPGELIKAFPIFPGGDFGRALLPLGI